MKKLFLLICFLSMLAACNITSAGIPANTSATIILIDRTDGITKEQRAVIFNAITAIKNKLHTTDQLIVYDVAGSYEEDLEKYTPLYSAIVPPHPDNCNEITTTCKKVEKRYNDFDKTFLDTFVGIPFDETSDQSYILESIKMIITTKQFQSFTNKKFVIFSNMLQNSKSISHYRNYPPVLDLEDLYIFDVNGTLINTNVDINMLPDRQSLQNKKLKNWWREYFRITGANRINIRKF